MKVISGGRSKSNGIDKIYIGRGTLFGNPFVIGQDGSREEVIEKYKRYFLSSCGLKAEALIRLKNKTLVCHCKPRDCHGDVIVEYIKSFEPKEFKQCQLKNMKLHTAF